MAHENIPSETVNSIFSQRFYQLFKSKNITQDTLASHLGVSRQMVALYYKDKSVPSYEVLIKIADYFDVTTDYLLGRTNDPSPKPSAVEELGLSPRIVDNLKFLNQEKPEAQIKKEALELLLSPNNIKELVCDISQYLIIVQLYCDIYEQNMHIAQQHTPDEFAYREFRRTSAISKYLPPDMQTLYRQNLVRLEKTEEDIEYRLFRLHGTISRIMESYFKTRKMKLLRRK